VKQSFRRIHEEQTFRRIVFDFAARHCVQGLARLADSARFPILRQKFKAILRELGL